MKKTLQEEKSRILEISKRINNLSSAIKPVNESLLLQGHVGELKIAIENFIKGEQKNHTAEPISPEEIKESLMKYTEIFFDGAMEKLENELDSDIPSPMSQETDEYHSKFNKNMTQGFKIDEGKKEK